VFSALVLKNERCCADSSAGFEKRTLLQQFQCWYRKTITAAGFGALVSKNDHCCGVSMAPFGKVTLLPRLERCL